MLAAVLAGCSPEPPDPPLTRSDLVIRLFEGLQKKDFKAALEQCSKLRAIGVYSNGFAEFEDSIRYNYCVAEAQRLLDAGDPQGARAFLDDAMRQSLNNQRLKSQLAELDKVVVLEKQVTQLRTAATPEAQREALQALQQLLRTYPPGEIFREEMRRMEAELEKPAPAAAEASAPAAP